MVSLPLTYGSAPWEKFRADTQVGWWEKLLAFLGFLVILGTFRSVLLSGGPGRTEGSPLFQAFAGGVYILGLMALVHRGIPRWAFRLLLTALPLVVLTLLPLVSTAWSQEPDVTLRRALALILSSSFALYLALRFDFRTCFNLLLLAFAVYVLLGVLAAGVPGLGITPTGTYAGAWRGLTGQKNIFGRTLAVCLAILAVAIALRMVDFRKIGIATLLVGFGALILAKSATPLAVFVAALMLGSIFYVALGGRVGGVRLRPELGITFLVVAAVVVALTVTYGWFTILEALGRDPTLTGRTKLWRWAADINEHRSWLGSGYRSFWIEGNTKYFFESFAWKQDAEGNLSDTFQGPDHAHSGYMDTYLELGILGVTLYIATILSGLLVIRRAMIEGAFRIGFIFAVILGFLLVYAVTEKSILQQSEDVWFLFSLIYLFAAKAILQARSPNLFDRRVEAGR